jgi:hypothetical protein
MKKWITGIAASLIIASVSVYSASPSAKAAVDSTYDQLKLLVDVMGIIRENYVWCIRSIPSPSSWNRKYIKI